MFQVPGFRLLNWEYCCQLHAGGHLLLEGSCALACCCATSSRNGQATRLRHFSPLKFLQMQRTARFPLEHMPAKTAGRGLIC